MAHQHHRPLALGEPVESREQSGVDPENRLVFSAGPLVGTGAPTAGRTTVSSLSPRGYPAPMWISASMGGYLGAELKYAGYDGVVVHGRATRSTLGAEVFEERYGEPNPDAELLRALQQAGVRIVVCGQSATAFGFRRGELAPGIEMAISAMTALVALQTDGYALIPWGAD